MVKEVLLQLTLRVAPSFFVVTMLVSLYTIALLSFSLNEAESFSSRGGKAHLSPLHLAPQDEDLTAPSDILECSVPTNPVLCDRLKCELYQLGASYDRGFGASPGARAKAQAVVEELERMTPENAAAQGIEGTHPNGSPLAGSWRMIWTTAVDVLLLNASPVFITGAVHQVFDPPVVTNVIDFLPRAQSLFPPDVVPSSLLRAKVQTKASPRQNKPNRVGLLFEKVQVQPLQILGVDVNMVPPLGFNLPKLPGTDNGDSPGYFDVTYLDHELLVIRQNAPGGLFALVRVNSIDP